jgi:hypothetical protein
VEIECVWLTIVEQICRCRVIVVKRAIAGKVRRCRNRNENMKGTDDGV